MAEARDGEAGDTGAAATGLPTAAPPAFHLLAKPTGSVCNLDCAYCFFLEKEKLYPGARPCMSDELLERYIRELIKAHRTPQVTIAWQGGEPTLMGLDFYRRAVELRPDFPEAHVNLGNVLRRQGELAAAVEAYRRAIALRPQFPEALSNLGNVLRDLLARRPTDVRAAEAIDVFCYQARKFIGAMTAAMGGLDTLVFSGGMGATVMTRLVGLKTL